MNTWTMKLARLVGLVIALAFATLALGPAAWTASNPKIVFLTAPQTLTAGATSAPITVQLQNQNGNPVNAGTGGVVVTLTTTSNSPGFAVGFPTANPGSVTIPKGSSSGTFQYRDTKADSPVISANASGLTGASQTETIVAADPASAIYTTQPSLTLAGSAITPAVAVQVFDQFGNPVPGATVSIAIFFDPNCPSSCSTLSGVPSTLPTTDGNGAASFSALSINNPGVGYTLRATATRGSGTANVTSNGFVISNDKQNCPPNCTVSGSNANGTGRSTATAAGTVSGNVLAITVANSITAPQGFCGAAPGTSYGVATGGQIDVVATGGSGTPTLTVTAFIDRSLVPVNAGASHFNICLGALNVTHLPPPTATDPTFCGPTTSPSQDNSFPTDTGSCADYDAGTNLFWGLLPDVTPGVRSCTDARVVFPGVLSKMKDAAGDVVITFCVPYPYDPTYSW
jgi:hypothetical protein